MHRLFRVQPAQPWDKTGRNQFHMNDIGRLFNALDQQPDSQFRLLFSGICDGRQSRQGKRPNPKAFNIVVADEMEILIRHESFLNDSGIKFKSDLVAAAENQLVFEFPGQLPAQIHKVAVVGFDDEVIDLEMIFLGDAGADSAA